MNPIAIINMMLAQNPQIKNNPMFNNAMGLFQSGNISDLKQLAENLARQQGKDINQLINQYKDKI